MPAFNFQKQFVEPIKNGTKTSTIRKLRKDGRQPCKEGDQIKLYTGMRTKNCQLIAVAKVSRIREIAIEIDVNQGSKPRITSIFFDDAAKNVGFCCPDLFWSSDPSLPKAEKEKFEKFVKIEGFLSNIDFILFMLGYHGDKKCRTASFRGWQIEWRDVF